ncbi:MAG: sugar ABC transporter substrate-binding protein [Lachnospiraceae bacterium]|jgi:ABC-type sugar transport system substrate-binding protein|nr:sugar ABC transporter substrate-binding protein [Lachnospiraceae bacterium]
MKRVIAITLTVLLFVGMIACGKSEPQQVAPEPDKAEDTQEAQVEAEPQKESEEIIIGISLDNLDDPFWVGIKKGIDAATEELSGKAKVEIQVCQGDANLQAKQIQDMVTAGAKAIACVYVDQEAIKQSVKLCNEKDIPFVYIDRTLESTEDAKVAWGIATDNLALTENGWEYMVEYAKENNIKWKVLELVGSLTDNNVLRRTEGFEKVMEENPEYIERVQSVPTEFNLEKALAGVTNAMQANPEINCIFMHSDFLLAPTIQALEAAGRYTKIGEEGHVALMPFSGNTGAVNAMKEGYAEMCFGMDVYKEGYEGVMAAYNLVMGNTDGYEATLDDAGFIMTQDNLDETAPRAYGSF